MSTGKNNKSNKADKVEAVEEKAPEAVVEAPVEVAPEPVVPEPVSTAPVEAEPAWDVETWREVSRQRIGVAPHVITGALSKKDTEAVYTEREIRALVEAFLNTPAVRG